MTRFNWKKPSREKACVDCGLIMIVRSNRKRCNPCKKKWHDNYMKEYYATHREQKQLAQAKWRKENPDRPDKKKKKKKKKKKRNWEGPGSRSFELDTDLPSKVFGAVLHPYRLGDLHEDKFIKAVNAILGQQWESRKIQSLTKGDT